MCNWIPLSKEKPKGGVRFIGMAENGEWNLFTAPNHDTIDHDDPQRKRIIMTKQQHLDKILDVYKVVKWMTPTA